MLKLCPIGQDGSAFFTFLFFFLHRLPRLLRLLLSEEDQTDRRVLVVMADRLWAHYVNHAHEVVTTLKRDSDSEDARREEEAV